MPKLVEVRSSADVMMEALLQATGQHDKLADMKRRLRKNDEPEELTSTQRILTAPVRVEFDFIDPIKTRRQLEVIAVALVRALAISQDHQRGAYPQLRDMRTELRHAAIEVQILRGKRPDLA